MSNTHEAPVVRIGEVRPHPNADKLELTDIRGYQMVIGKGSFKPGDLAVFIQPDSVVPQTEPFAFIWKDHVGIDGKVPERRRRIAPKRLRKEWSEGLLMPAKDFAIDIATKDDAVDSFAFTAVDGNTVIASEGDDVALAIGVTHYVPEFDRESTVADTAAAPRRKYPKSLKGWFFFLLHKLGLRNAGGRSYAQEVSFNLPVYDVDAYKNARDKFRPGEMVLVTEKIHGSNARYVVVDDVFYAGSHHQWKQNGPGVWWNVARAYPEIQEFCHQNPGVMLIGEVGPTQKGFRYGKGDGEVFFFAFDVYKPLVNPDDDSGYEWAGNEGFAPHVPVLYSGPFDLEVIKSLVDGKSTVPGAENIREGVVIRSRERDLRLKIVSNEYLAKEPKDDGAPE